MYKLHHRNLKSHCAVNLALYPGLPLLAPPSKKIRPGKTYHVTDVTDCGQFQERGRTPTHSEHANTGLPKSVHLLYTQGG